MSNETLEDLPVYTFLPLDVGFDLRATRTPIALPPLPFIAQYAVDNCRDVSAIFTQTCRTPTDLAQLVESMQEAGYVCCQNYQGEPPE